MPYATNSDDGIRIHYEVEGKGSPLVMLTGFAGSGQRWREGYVQPLIGDQQIILIDPRGHGGSPKPHEPDDYAPHKDVADVIAVLDHLRIDRAHLMGYSMGGGIALWVARRAPERARSLIIGGAVPMPRDQILEDLLTAGTEGIVQVFEERFDAVGDEVPESWKAISRANDIEALIARRMSRGMVPDHVLAGMTIPALFYAGTEDSVHARAKRAAELMPNATFVSIEGRDHVQAAAPSVAEFVIPHIKEFLSGVESELAAAT